MNAATVGGVSKLMEGGLENTWRAFEVNVRTLLDFAWRFEQQDGDRLRHLINISTSGIHNFNTDSKVIPLYGLTKNAGTMAMQQYARQVDPSKLRIVSINPGGVLTEMARNSGMDESVYDWDDGKCIIVTTESATAVLIGYTAESLPGHFSVWATSDEASFLHGHFVSVHWDVNELKASKVRQAMDDDYHYLTVGVIGVDGDK